MIDRYIVFSSHARDRLRELNLTLPKCSYLIYTAVVEEFPKDIAKYKNEKYKERATYLRNGTLLITLLPIKESVSKDDCYLVVSLYDQRMDLK